MASVERVLQRVATSSGPGVEPAKYGRRTDARKEHGLFGCSSAGRSAGHSLNLLIR